MKIDRYSAFTLLGGVLLLASCNDFLDELPDNRTEIDTQGKITKLLVSAYSKALPVVVHEQMSDNVTDRGIAYTWGDDNCHDAYYFKESFSSIGEDSPYALWERNYSAAAEANRALEAIKNMGDSHNLSAQRGEALLCRAYAHFTLANIFCQAYNPQSSSTDPGIPYVVDVNDKVFTKYERGTVNEVYQKIDADIKEGLPLIDDNLYTQPRYHFNKAAANAFAAQFYLFYGDYQRAVAHATAAIGEDPTSVLRDFSEWSNLTGGGEYTDAWVRSTVAANLLLQGTVSVAGRMYVRSRAVHTIALLNETLASPGPWGNTSLVYANYVRYYSSGSTPSYIFPKQMEYFVTTDPVQGIGYAYIMCVAYSVEKTLLNRAEAYAMLEKYDEAAADLSYFYVAAKGSVAGASAINAFYENSSEMYKKAIAPRFTVNAGMQENMIHACLHARRILTLHEGVRMLDIKRYGIAYTHRVDNDADIPIVPYDKRLALQIPNLVISAGMEPNPR